MPAAEQSFIRHDPSRVIRAPRGTEITAKSWQTEAPKRMLMNNLDPEVAERPEDLVVYGGTEGMPIMKAPWGAGTGRPSIATA